MKYGKYKIDNTTSCSLEFDSDYDENFELSNWLNLNNYYVNIYYNRFKVCDFIYYKFKVELIEQTGLTEITKEEYESAKKMLVLK